MFGGSTIRFVADAADRAVKYELRRAGVMWHNGIPMNPAIETACPETLEPCDCAPYLLKCDRKQTMAKKPKGTKRGGRGC